MVFIHNDRTQYTKIKVIILSRLMTVLLLSPEEFKWHYRKFKLQFISKRFKNSMKSNWEKQYAFENF